MLIEFVKAKKKKFIICHINNGTECEIDKMDIQQCPFLGECHRATSDCSGFIATGGHKLTDRSGHRLANPIKIMYNLCILKKYFPGPL